MLFCFVLFLALIYRHHRVKKSEKIHRLADVRCLQIKDDGERESDSIIPWIHFWLKFLVAFVNCPKTKPITMRENWKTEERGHLPVLNSQPHTLLFICNRLILLSFCGLLSSEIKIGLRWNNGLLQRIATCKWFPGKLNSNEKAIKTIYDDLLSISMIVWSTQHVYFEIFHELL